MDGARCSKLSGPLLYVQALQAQRGKVRVEEGASEDPASTPQPTPLQLPLILYGGASSSGDYDSALDGQSAHDIPSFQ